MDGVAQKTKPIKANFADLSERAEEAIGVFEIAAVAALLRNDVGGAMFFGMTVGRLGVGW